MEVEDKSIYTFHRSGKPVAEVCLTMDPSGIVVMKWHWTGDPEVIEGIGLPDAEDRRDFGAWNVLLTQTPALARLGLTWTARGEGPPPLMR